VDHLVDDDDVAGALKDLDQVVVRAWHHRWAGVEAHDAALGERKIARHAPQLTRGLASLRDRLRLRRQRRNPSVRRIDHERRPPRADQPSSVGFPPPAQVVDAWIRLRTRDAAQRTRRDLLGLRALLIDLLLECRGLGFGEECLPRQLRRSFQGGDGREVPGALQVGITPWRARGRLREGGPLGEGKHCNGEHGAPVHVSS
jgi:hypothetical protein